MRTDCHVHVVGPLERYPQSSFRTYTAVVASLETLQSEAAKQGIDRFVIVQPSFYGTDNSMLQDALNALGDAGRGVAAVDPSSVSPQELASLGRSGVRGLRINLYSDAGRMMAKGSLAEVFASTMSLAKDQGWHVEVIAPLEVLEESAEVLAGSSAQVVIDHYGIFGQFRPTDSTGQALLDLLGLSHVWIKLSAPYRSSPNPVETRPDRRWLEAMLSIAQDRSVWGSDWPHTPAREYQAGEHVSVANRPISYEGIVGGFVEAIADAEVIDQLFVTNPARLYGFSQSS